MIRVRSVHFGALLIAAAATACSIDVQGTGASLAEELRFGVAAAEPVELRLTTFDGAIRIREWDRAEVLVEIERRGPDEQTAEALVVNQMQDGNRIVIEAPSRNRSERGGMRFGPWISPAVNFTATVPRRVALEARTGDGLIDVRDLQGTIDLRSGDGRIVAAGLEGTIGAHTGDGSILLDRVNGTVTADSGDGAIEIAGVLTGLDVRTGDGSVRVDAAEGSAAEGEWRITTGDGRIAVRVPSGFNAAVDASSGDGPVRVEGLVPSRSDRGEREPRRVVGQMGSGGGRLHLRTGDGPVDVTY